MENDTTVTGDLLANDSDPDGDNLTITTSPIDSTDNGELTINPDGTYTYDPDPNFVGVDTFTYEVCDDGTPMACDTVLVTIEVLPADGTNDTYATDDASTGDEGVVQGGNVTDNDNEPEGDNITVTVLDSTDNGTITILPDGTWTFTPDPDFTGNDEFVYMVCDDGNPVACDSATVSITVLADSEICVTVDAKVFLEGALIDDDGALTYSSLMRTNLNDLRLLPGQSFSDVDFFGDVKYVPAGHPYNVQPWLYMGTEGDSFDSNGDPNNGDAGYPSTVVDWVLVSLRTTDSDSTGSEICQRAALLHQDGTVEFVDSTCCTVDGSSTYYITIEHRNHLLVMSDTLVPIVGDTSMVYDFTNKESFVAVDPDFGTTIGVGQKEVSSQVYAMFGGNGEQEQSQNDTDLNVDDEIIWGGINGNRATYRFGDFNLNGDVNFNDRIIWELNNGKFTGVTRDKNQ